MSTASWSASGAWSRRHGPSDRTLDRNGAAARMSFLDRIAECNNWDPAGFRPFLVAGRAVGQVRDGFAERLAAFPDVFAVTAERSEEHTSELQSLMRISYAVFCLKKKKSNRADTTK